MPGKQKRVSLLKDTLLYFYIVFLPSEIQLRILFLNQKYPHYRPFDFQTDNNAEHSEKIYLLAVNSFAYTKLSPLFSVQTISVWLFLSSASSENSFSEYSL